MLLLNKPPRKSHIKCINQALLTFLLLLLLLLLFILCLFGYIFFRLIFHPVYRRLKSHCASTAHDYFDQNKSVPNCNKIIFERIQQNRIRRSMDNIFIFLAITTTTTNVITAIRSFPVGLVQVEHMGIYGDMVFGYCEIVCGQCRETQKHKKKMLTGYIVE